jgi:SnoaL-like domain
VSVSDRLQIAEAISGYFFALDAFADLPAIAAFFSEDAVWTCYDCGADAPSIRFDSPAQFVAAMQPQRATIAAAGLRHHLTGLVFTSLGETEAETTIKVLVTAQPSPESAPVVRNTARVRARWRKADAGWKIADWVIHRESTA